MLIEISTTKSNDITAVLVRHGLRLEAKVNVQNRAGEHRVWYGLFTRDTQKGETVGATPVEVVSR